MHSVFVSYSHADSEFVERLIRDLRDSGVPATYDRWLLKVGDSLLERISTAVAESSFAIVVLSPASVNSNWVKKELNLAMAGEMKQGAVKVLPAVIADCELPPVIADKLYAEFRRGYYLGLRSLLRAISPSIYEDYGHTLRRKEEIEFDRNDLERALDLNDSARISEWFRGHSHVLTSLFGRGLLVSEAISKVVLDGRDVADFLILNGQSFRYEFTLVTLGPSSLSTMTDIEVLQQVEELDSRLNMCREHEAEVRRIAAIRLKNGGAAGHLAANEGFSKLHLHLAAKLIAGRRHEYDDRVNAIRSRIQSADGLEIVSYDRVLEAIVRLRDR